MSGSKRISAVAFWEAFKGAVPAHLPRNGQGLWSMAMFDVLHRAQSRFDVWCQCRQHPSGFAGHSGERMGIDFTWYPNTDEIWSAPIVAIEHENTWRDAGRDQDHWKVNQIAATLRVFIGYCRTLQHVDDYADTLRHRETNWLSVPAGEALLILGYAGMPVDGFHAWSCQQGRPDTWQKLSSRAHPGADYNGPP
jgi:hypothetical protein